MTPEMEDDPREILLNMLLSMYVGHKCYYCKRVFDSVEIIKEIRPIVIYVVPLTFGCDACFKDAAKKVGLN